MKIRSRNYKALDKKENFWTPFVDIMSTIALVFFFIMLIFTGLVYGKYKIIKNTYDQIDDIAKKRSELYEKVEKKLKPELKDNIIFDKEKGKLEIKTEVLFAVDSYKLTWQGKVIARKVSEAFYDLLENKEYREKIDSIEIRGHTDNTYKSDYNRFLSTDRATSFVNEMLPNDSKYEKYASYFKAGGMSKFVPKEGTVNNQTVKQKEQNRRIEIYINVSNKDIEKAIKKLINSK